MRQNLFLEFVRDAIRYGAISYLYILISSIRRSVIIYIETLGKEVHNTAANKLTYTTIHKA